MFQTKVVQKTKIYFKFNICFRENRAVYEIIWENTESTTAFPQQQKLPESATVLLSAFAAYLLTLRQMFLE